MFRASSPRDRNGRIARSCGTLRPRERPDVPHERSARPKGAGWREAAEHSVAASDQMFRASGLRHQQETLESIVTRPVSHSATMRAT
ncbi:MAG TPA: hypothetical protein VIU11_18410, partial [Nakamurella sp.]